MKFFFQRQELFVEKKIASLMWISNKIGSFCMTDFLSQLAEAGEETEDQRRQVQNLKRKSHRLTQDMQDMKLHLEEQLGRNSELEKKQRK